ncbi:hypothetical protein SCUP234_12603 [Seiridium cupressi]|uniref:Uncharacterized protein n=1 Tax=Seiridium unicorne TaxID=138068 RepID=A0ABR2VC38_9PEZI
MDNILSAPEHLVRATLIALCNDRTQLKKAIDYLDKMGHSAARPAPPLATDNKLKRKAAEAVKICVQCQEPYHESDNGGKHPCKYHNGNVSPAPIFSDVTSHAGKDCEENREEYPDGFKWSCCDKNGTHPGCTRGQHRDMGVTRGRYPAEGLYEKAPDQWSSSSDDNPDADNGKDAQSEI